LGHCTLCRGCTGVNVLLSLFCRGYSYQEFETFGFNPYGHASNTPRGSVAPPIIFGLNRQQQMTQFSTADVNDFLDSSLYSDSYGFSNVSRSPAPVMLLHTGPVSKNQEACSLVDIVLGFGPGVPSSIPSSGTKVVFCNNLVSFGSRC